MRIVHASRSLKAAIGFEGKEIEGESLDALLSPASRESFNEGMALAKEGERAVVICSSSVEMSHPLPLKVYFLETGRGGLWLFFGTHRDVLDGFQDWEKDERAKELFCYYSVAEWIEASSTIDEFFTKLPDYLCPGMRFPEQTVVYSLFRGVEYGQAPSSPAAMEVKLVVNGEEVGEIQVGYLDPSLEFLPEEHRLLTEIGRTVCLAIERRELFKKLLMKQQEEEDYNRRLQELQEEIEKRTRELQEKSRTLERINTYLERVNRGWEESKTRLETIFNAIPEEVALIDKNRNVVMVNHRDVAPGTKCYKAFFDRDTPCENCRLSRIIKEKTPIHLTIKEGDKFFEVQALPIFDKRHEVDGMMEFYRDVTLEKTYEEQIRRADQMAALGQLVSGIGHEINNPNQFIRGNIKIIKQAMEDILPIMDEYRKGHPDLRIARLDYDFFRKHIMTLIEDMGHGSERIKGIVEGLRRFARKDEGLLVDKVDVNTVINICVRLVHNEVHKHADIVLELKPDIPTFQGNSQKIEQVLVNLIVNAAQAIPDDTKGQIRVSTFMENDHVIIRIADNGKGMDEKTRKQIFDPFFFYNKIIRIIII